ncbi:MAG: tetratricopeptide repeat protein, partial [Candidatus Aminicenantes bacterium]|nr:tetratricopeptide repeat protein [Candidatus Aminicenantes bacterium]
MMKLLKAATTLILFVLLTGTAVFSKNAVCLPGNVLIAGQSGGTGAAKGKVSDEKTGAVIENAKIVIEFTKSSAVKYEIKTDEKGSYYKGGLTPGYYKFTVEKEGYLPTTVTIRVRLADTVQNDFNLQTLEVIQIEESANTVKRGMKLLNDDHWEEAVKTFSEGIAEDESNPLLYFYRAVAQEKNGQIDEALEDYRKVMELKPDFILPYSRSGKIYARQQKYEKAVELYKESVRLGDQDITTLYNYGVVLLNLGKSADAKAVFESLLALDVDYADAYYHLGIILIGQGDSEKAKELLQRFLELDPENPYAPVAKQILANLD